MPPDYLFSKVYKITDIYTRTNTPTWIYMTSLLRKTM